jgi:cysteine desulfurase
MEVALRLLFIQLKNKINVYFDNAATTPIYPEVISCITEVMMTDYGNPSSTHQFGRSAKVRIETARKELAALLMCNPQEIIFTSGGSEGDNWILKSAVESLGIKRIITTRLEHHAVLHPIEHLQKKYSIAIIYLNVDENGAIDLTELGLLLDTNQKTLVSLMHVNNETGNELPVQKVAELCEKFGAFFHSDTVQSIGKTRFDLSKTPIHFLVGSAHKFHGPKGVGFIYIKKNIPLSSFIKGGSQEKGLRAGTESVHQIIGMVAALQLSYEQLENNFNYISKLKNHAVLGLKEVFPGLIVNGGANTFYTILNVRLPIDLKKASMLLFSLDMKGIAVSRGSACQSGSAKPSHVLAEMMSETEQQKPSIRLSFSKYNTLDEVDYLVEVLANI